MTGTVGIDLGSRTTKIVRLENLVVTDLEIFPTAADPLEKVRQSLAHLKAGHIVATGYGRHLVCEQIGASRVTEIRACAHGAHHLYPDCRVIIDVGGQDCKVIRVDDDGRVIDFEMNDRCAAGTGRFMEMMAQTLEVSLDEFVRLALGAPDFFPINSMCTVFAESEVVSLITAGKSKECIALGLHVTISRRLSAMLSKYIRGEGDILFVGGGAKNDCLHQLLEKEVGRKITRPENPLIVTALGAALLAG
ncbi:MAG: acyl-CoA dehydratase activase [Candidatus Sumerlaeota bacterium]|nr:acyl-CoA dehydratase activase [Candidatus Sumerlaeota bacterium]